MAQELLTIGYQGATIDGIIAALRAADIATLIDVRDVPWSRRAEFTKGALHATLGDHGIAYLHLRGLGNPKAGRDAARDGDLARYHGIFDAHLETPPAQADLAAAAERALREPICLMCQERDPAHCHRTIVAARLAALTGLAVRHLTAARPQDSQQLALL